MIIVIALEERKFYLILILNNDKGITMYEIKIYILNKIVIKWKRRDAGARVCDCNATVVCSIPSRGYEKFDGKWEMQYSLLYVQLYQLPYATIHTFINKTPIQFSLISYLI